MLYAQSPEPIGTPYVYAKHGTTGVKLWVVQPSGMRADLRPAIVFFHGGGFTHGTPAAFNRQAGYLAQRGMVAVQVEYRLEKVDNNEPITPSVEDGTASFCWVREHARMLHIDSQRIAAAGGSAGGYLAAYLATVAVQQSPQCPNGGAIRPDALVLFNPVVTLGSGSCCFARVGDRYRLVSPLFQVKAGTPPALILQGDSDKLVNPKDIRSFATRLEKAGGKAELRMYPGQDHGFFNQGDSFYQTLLAVDQFLCSLHWLSGTPDERSIRGLPATQGPSS